MNKETEAIHFLKRLVYHVERSYSGTFKELHQAKEFLESLDESPAPTSIKTAEEMMIKHNLHGAILEPASYYFERVKLAMQEYKNQSTGDKWSDEDMLSAYWGGLEGFMGSGHEDPEKYDPTGGAKEWLSGYKAKKS